MVLESRLVNSARAEGMGGRPVSISDVFCETDESADPVDLEL